MAEEFDVCLLLDVAPELDFDSHRQSELAKGAIRSENRLRAGDMKAYSLVNSGR
jgi:hypothetical protein